VEAWRSIPPGPAPIGHVLEKTASLSFSKVGPKQSLFQANLTSLRSPLNESFSAKTDGSCKYLSIEMQRKHELKRKAKVRMDEYLTKKRLEDEELLQAWFFNPISRRSLKGYLIFILFLRESIKMKALYL
jgi:hypothetical protein